MDMRASQIQTASNQQCTHTCQHHPTNEPKRIQHNMWERDFVVGVGRACYFTVGPWERACDDVMQCQCDHVAEINDDDVEDSDGVLKDVAIDIPLALDTTIEDEDELDERFDKIIDLKTSYQSRYNTISREQMLPLLSVTRDKNNVIIDDYHKTTPILTKYEKSKIIGLRAIQLANGLKPFIDVGSDVIDPIVIADMELHEKKIPFILKRPVSLTNFEYWPLQELEII